MKKKSEYLKDLGFSPTSNPTIIEIKSTYRKLSLTHHPDKGGNEERYKKICEAKEALLNNKFAPENKEQKVDLPDDIGDRLASKITNFFDNCADKVFVKDEKIIFKLIKNNLVCIKLETNKDQRLLINNYPIKIQYDK